MMKTLQTRLQRAGRWLPMALLPLLPLAAHAQTLNYSPANAVNVAGTYTDLGTTGTAITTTTNDDANSAAQAIGFAFSYNGATFTQFVLSTNGFIKLGAAAPSATNLFLCNVIGCTTIDPLTSTNAADVNLIMPFNFDLEQGTGTAEYRLATTGTAPNRVCTIQWKNVSDKSDAGATNKQYTNFSFQTKLYETTNNIEFVYGPATASAATPESRFPVVGIKGSGSASGQDVLASKTTGAAAWTATTFITGTYPGSTHNFRNAAPPDAGRTYRFAPGIAAGPTNDNCTGATALTVSGSCAPLTSTNASATASTTPAPSCFTTAVNNDVWFTAVVPTNGTLTVTTSAITGSALNDTGLAIYSGSCTSLTEIGCNDDIDAAGGNFFSGTTLTGLTAGATVYIRVWSYNNSPTGQFGICATTPTPIDAGVGQVYTLTKLPIPQGAPHAVRALITNNGTTALTAITVNLAVSGANTFTNSQTVASLAVGASTTVTFAAFVPTVTGTNTVTVTVAVAGDGNTANNSASVSQAVNTSTYSYADGSAPTSARGFGPSATVVNSFAVRYSAVTSVNVTQVRALLVDFVGAGMAGSTIGKTVYAVVLNPTTGAVLGRSADYVVMAADVTGTTYTNFTLNTPVAIPVNTDFLVGIAQTYQAGQTTQYFPVATQPETPSRVGAYYTASISTPAAPVDITVSATAANPSNYRFMIEAVTTSTSAPACPPVSALTASAITQTGATLSFTAPAGTAGYVVTYTAQGGTPTTVTPAPTGSPIVLTGLSSGTSYTVSVVASCAAGANSIPVSTTFTTLTPPPAYATLPYAQDFESWVNVASTKDVPSNNWRNTPATGDNSWRREDEGFATASWRYATAETSAAPPYPVRFSTGAHSARFHTYGANTGDQGKLDLYVDLSGTSTAPRMLSFDYINPTGLDKLEVFLSTDGGATFATTPLLTATTNAAFTAKSVVVPSTAATTVLRFQATADNLGNDDIGIDNLRLALVLATRDQALAATVGLFPNPAQQRVSLRLPAGPLTTAAATLLNALGQVVATQTLALPASGGTTSLDLSGLAPGLYSLRLQAADAVVVKQLVIE